MSADYERALAQVADYATKSVYGQQQVTLDERLRATEASIREANAKIDALCSEVAALGERIDRSTEGIRRAVRDQEKAIGTAMRALPRKAK